MTKLIPFNYDTYVYAEGTLELTTLKGYEVTQLTQMDVNGLHYYVGVCVNKIHIWHYNGVNRDGGVDYDLWMKPKARKFWYVFDPSVDYYPMIFSSENKAAEYRATQMPNGVIKTLEFEVN